MMCSICIGKVHLLVYKWFQTCALFVLLVGVVPNLPWLINSMNSGITAGPGAYLYDFGWLLGLSSTIVAMLLFATFRCPWIISLSGPSFPRRLGTQITSKISH